MATTSHLKVHLSHDTLLGSDYYPLVPQQDIMHIMAGVLVPTIDRVIESHLLRIYLDKPHRYSLSLCQ